ncbi:histone-lysine N-methyltransferase SETMAR [Trichonephila clavipes]|nr:histone-lysine N-methyltransferase SETMAR [Trichonephila clavipes]
MDVNKEKIRYILQFFFDKSKNASQVAEIVNGVYGADTVTGRSVIENVDKITEIIEVDWLVSSHSIAQKLKVAYKIA